MQEEGADGATPSTILAVGLSFFHFDRPKKVRRSWSAATEFTASKLSSVISTESLP